MRIALPLVMFAMGAAVSASAQQSRTQEEPSSGEIIVEGAKDRDRQIADFVRALTDAPVRGQIGRFDWAVCPVAVGLGQAQNDAVADRMRRVAKAAVIPVAEQGCKPNVFVIVTPDKKALIEQLYALHPAYFSEIPEYKVRAFAGSSGPAAAWHVEGLLSADGTAVPRDNDGRYIYEGTRDPSRISAPTRPHFLASIVVVERSALAGLTTTQLADYAAMRAFARTDPERLRRANAPSILTVLDAPMDSAIPVTLTQWDFSFLKGLYAAVENQYANHQRSDIRRSVKKDLEKAQERDAVER